ncbi:histidine kinase [Mucilaginibacter sp.]|uniref:sensor histidine kinase n=1 Tax=Mucilaginibacter sp. TaxID=1882438 RepID=UPI0025F033CD|nr:histidine kinase [Mucilaginibacter sp.]
MKKIFLLLIIIIALAKPANAQIMWGAYSQSYPSGLTDKPGNIGIVSAIKEINNAFWGDGSCAALTEALKRDTAFIRNRPLNFVAITTYDTAKAHFFLHGVDKSNANNYEYRVMIEDGPVVTPWQKPASFTDYMVQSASSMPQMAYLGGYNTALGNRLIVDVRLKNSGKIVAAAVVKWQPVKPTISQIYLPDELNFFLKRLAHPWSYRQDAAEIDKWKMKYPADQIDRFSYLPKKLIVAPKDNNLVFYFSADIYHKEQLEYELVKNDNTITPWKYNDFDNNFIWLKSLAPGRYLLKMRYTAQREHVTTYPFEVKTPWYDSVLFKIIAGILSCASLGFVFFMVRHVKQKENAEKELAKKTKLQLELKSIYAQLNPHFIFNALSSIQGLINKQDIKGANSYLSDFARLMRDSLNNSNKDQTSLDKEILTLETYLKLEQLRFGFTYHVNIDKNINAYETEVPSLLLQPLVENAIKHGISALQEKGEVAVNFTRRDNNMIVNIKDNGPGFLGNTNTDGFGLKLTHDRIKLLNEFTKGQPIKFEVKKNKSTGADIELTFNNWFL